jgi:hypothetical protein
VRALAGPDWGRQDQQRNLKLHHELAEHWTHEHVAVAP